MSPPPSPDIRRHGRDGFTLIEALAALTVVVIGLGALSELTHSTVNEVEFAERRVELIETARKALAALPARDQPITGEVRGELNGQRWRLAARPYFAPSIPTEGGGWTPELVSLEVRASDGSRLEIDSVRLSHGGAP
ncbi:MAG: prepilin-type N-terminal cleavage/methylation domain-containing protein [Roseiarcus sp.]